jgi:hypothetical protein
MPSTTVSNELDSINITIRDLNLRYLYCTFLVKNSDIVGYATGFLIQNGNILVHYYTIKKGLVEKNIKTIEYSKDTIDFRIPKLGYFNIEELGACRIFRASRRRSEYKYLRGFANGVVKVDYYQPDNIGYTLRYNFNFYKAAYYVYNPTYYTSEKAVKMLLSFEKVSVAISREFAVAVDANINRLFLYYLNIKIGVYVIKNECFRLFTNIFNDKLNDLEVKYFNDNSIKDIISYPKPCEIANFYDDLEVKNVISE